MSDMPDDMRAALRERLDARLHEVDREIVALENTRVALIGEQPRRGRPPGSKNGTGKRPGRPRALVA